MNFEIGTDNHIDSTCNNETNNTSCLLSSDVIIKVNDQKINAVQQFNFTENLQDAKIYIFCSRIYFDNISIIEAFTGKNHINQVRKNFNIDLCFPDRVFTIKNVKITNHHISFSVDNLIVLEDVSMEGTAISTKMNEKPAIKLNHK